LRTSIALTIAGLTAATAALVSVPDAAQAAPTDPPGTQCARYASNGFFGLGNLDYNLEIAFQAGLDVPRVVHDVTSYVAGTMTKSTCDQYPDVKSLIVQANAKLPGIDAVARAGGDQQAIMTEATKVKDIYYRAEVLAWSKR
jgi:hypothetical protein